MTPYLTSVHAIWGHAYSTYAAEGVGLTRCVRLLFKLRTSIVLLRTRGEGVKKSRFLCVRTMWMTPQENIELVCYRFKNRSKLVKIGHFRSCVVILAIFELTIITLRVKITFLTLQMVNIRLPWPFCIKKHLTSTLSSQKSTKMAQNLGHLGHFWRHYDVSCPSDDDLDC